jgi:hypothetical protein
MPAMLKDRVLEKNRQVQSALINGGFAAREKYRQTHKTKLLHTSCMDGRMRLGHFSGLPLGVVETFYNIGGVFDVTWPEFEKDLTRLRKKADGVYVPAVLAVGYHYSKSNPNLGCKGHGYDKEASIIACNAFVSQLQSQQSDLYGVVVGLETDTDSVLIHGKNGQLFNTAEMNEVSGDIYRDAVKAIVPDMAPEMFNDFLSFVEGLQKKTMKTMTEGRFGRDLDHREYVLGLGPVGAFDWLEDRNTALLIGPYSPTSDIAVEKAAGILDVNLLSSQIPSEDGLVVVVAETWNQLEPDGRENARQHAQYRTTRALEIIKESAPKLMSSLGVITGIVETTTQRLEVVPTK